MVHACIFDIRYVYSLLSFLVRYYIISLCSSLNQVGGQALLEYGLRLTLIGVNELEPLNLFQSYCSFDKVRMLNHLYKVKLGEMQGIVGRA